MTRILVVDDEPNIRKAVGILLKSEGFDLDYAQDGQEALSAIEKSKPDLILLDMFMPRLSGKRMVELLRGKKDYERTKVIFLTVALPSESGKRELESLGISDYITKPFDGGDLLRRVRKALK